MQVTNTRLLLSGLTGGLALGYLALQTAARAARGDLGSFGIVALLILGILWLVAPAVAWLRGLLGFAAGWALSGTVLAIGVLVATVGRAG
ncbi:MAG: hypothetical protein ACR2J8_02720 [Thermomicrobiales bacterium]